MNGVAVLPWRPDWPGSHRAETTHDRRRTAPRGGARTTSALEALGPVPERARLGHGARGLQRRTAPPGSTSRTTTRARAPTAGTRTASPASATATSSICFALALWNGRDPILKERLFGLTGNEGNHGEDVKEYYFYLDSHADALLHEVPLQVPAGGVSLRASWSRRTAGAARGEPEFELIDTGVFDDDRYFDVVVEYAKADAEDILMRDHGRQPRPRGRAAAPAADACGSATRGRGTRDARAAALRGAAAPADGCASIAAETPTLRPRAGSTATGARRCSSPRTRPTPRGCSARERRPATSRTASTTTSCTAERDAVNPAQHRHQGRRALRGCTCRPAATTTVRLRLHRHGAGRRRDPFGATSTRSSPSGAQEADEFYATVIPADADADDARASCARRSPACSGRSSSITTS